MFSKIFHKEMYDQISVTLQEVQRIIHFKGLSKETRRWTAELGYSGRMDLFEVISQLVFSFTVKYVFLLPFYTTKDIRWL